MRGRLHCSVRNLFDADSPLAAAYREVRWEETPLGPVQGWSDALRGAVDLMLNTRFPVTLMWGRELTLVYNDAYVRLIGDKHPSALGRPAAKVFPEVWDLIGPMLESVLEGEGATWVEDEYVPLHRRGFLEECYFTFSYSPVRGTDGRIEGVMDVAAETTEEVVSRRRLRLLSELTERLADVWDPEDVPLRALPLLREDAKDFAAVDVRLAGAATGPTPGLPDEPTVGSSPGDELVEAHAGSEVAWFSLASPLTQERSHLVVALSPHLAPDETYLGFLRLVAATLRQALDRVRVRTAERLTAETQRGVAEALQRNLLREPSAPGMASVAVRYQPALQEAQVGGDWYDLFELPDGTLTVVIGDVAGHDQQAAAAMAQVRNMLRGVAYTLHPTEPRDVLTALDRAMSGTTEDIVASAVLAQVSSGAAPGLSLRWSNAGHPPPALIEPDGSVRLLETPPDLLLGITGDAPRSDSRLALEPGATVVFYTDGLIERRGTAIDASLAWLADVLKGRHLLDVESLCDHLLESADADEDDVALLVLRA